MKQFVLALIIITFPFIALHAADNTIGNDEPVSAGNDGQGIEEVFEETIEEASAEADTETIAETETEASDDNFVPSIQITEDLPVAFPVDI